MFAFDTNYLTYLVAPESKPITNKDGSIIENIDIKIDFLVDSISKENKQILIPTPVLSEVLVFQDIKNIENVFSKIKNNKLFKIASFDSLAALELSFMNKNIPLNKDDYLGTRQKVKIDRQIAAICKINNVEILYTDDKDLITFCSRNNIETINHNQLLLPAQGELRL